MLHTVYVINMDRSATRWKRWKVERRVRVVRIKAIDGLRDLHGQSSEHKYFERHRSAPTRRQVRGCALSHMKAMRRAVEQGDPFAIICEDDVILEDCASERVDMVLDRLPTDWELVFFAREANKDIAFPFSKPTAEGRWNFSGCSMYMISRAAMLDFIGHVEREGFQRAVDWELIDFFPGHRLHPRGAYRTDGTTTVQVTNARGLRRVLVVVVLLALLAALAARSAPLRGV